VSEDLAGHRRALARIIHENKNDSEILLPWDFTGRVPPFAALLSNSYEEHAGSRDTPTGRL